jgi:serine/threonine protein kinase
LKKLSPNEIPLNELEIGGDVRSGTYGRVCVGKWKKKKYRVALKFCQNKGKIDEFMKEANLMISLPSHPNVVQMFGVCIKKEHHLVNRNKFKLVSINCSLKVVFSLRLSKRFDFL